LKSSSSFSIFDFANQLNSLKKGAAVKNNITFSLSLQKEIHKHKYSMDSEINKAFKELNIKSLLNRSNIMKQKGYSTASIIYLMVLLPFLKQYLSYLWSGKACQSQINAQKDTYYRFLNHEYFNWRKLVYLLALKVINNTGDVPLKQKVLIADDTLAPKTGKKMEMVSYHFDHTRKQSMLGYQCLQLGYHNGMNFFPIDVAFKTSRNRPNTTVRDIDKRTNGWQRRKEAFNKKTDMLVEMANRAWNAGIDASFMLFDSWFAHDDVISKIHNTGYGVICRLKRGRVKYVYQGKAYTLKQLWQNVVKKRTKWLADYQVKAVSLNVQLPKSGHVQVVFISDGKKQWQAFLSTDQDLEASEVLSYYSIRWSIEVFFKDAKQLLYLGSEQSNTFDAVIACYSLSMIRYLLLVYIFNKSKLIGPIGPLFRELSDDQVYFSMAEEFWRNVKELIIMSSQLLSDEIDRNNILYILEVIENVLCNQLDYSTAKL